MSQDSASNISKELKVFPLQETNMMVLHSSSQNQANAGKVKRYLMIIASHPVPREYPSQSGSKTKEMCVPTSVVS